MIKFNKLYNDGFGKAILTLASGSIIAQLLTFLAAPFLTRLFSPKELGIYALILTAESLFGSAICGRYDASIISEKDDNKIFPLIKLSFLITIIFSLIASLGYGTYYFVIKDDYREYAYAIVLIFIMLILNGLIRILESYNNRNKEYKVMTSVYVLRTSIQNIGAIIFGLFKIGALGLLISHIFGMIFGFKRQSKTILPYLKKVWNSNSIDIKEVMKSHYRQPLYSAPAVFANRFSYASILLFIESLYGLTALGYYSIAYKALGLPLTVMSNNVSKVFFQEASREYDSTGGFVNSFKKTTLLLLIFTIPMVLVLYFLSPIIFELVFGDGWIQAGIYVQILSPMFGIRFIVNTITNGLQVVKKQNLELLLQILFIVSSVSAFIISKFYDLNINQFLGYISLFFSIVYCMFVL
jgi:O-antigen/teichoic acid export membrane protein